MNAIKLFLWSLLILMFSMSKQTYADKAENTIRFNVKITSPKPPFIVFGHLKGKHAQETEMIMLDQGQGSIKREIPAKLQIASFGEIPVLVGEGGVVNLSIELLKERIAGHAYTARFKGINAFKQSVPYQISSLYRISVEDLKMMNVEALKKCFLEKGRQAQQLIRKAKIEDPQERSLLLRYESMLRVLVIGAFNRAHEPKQDIPAEIYTALLEAYNFKGEDLNRICQGNTMDSYVQILLAGKSGPSDARLKKMELLLTDRNQFVIQRYVIAEFRAMFRPKGLTPELDAFYSKLKLACTDAKLLKELDQFYTYQVNLMPGKPATDFALRDLNGKMVKISDFKGKMLVIDCWGTWCSGCLENLPFFEKIAEGYKDSTDIVFMTMALEPEDGLSWRQYIKEHHMEKGIHLHIPDVETEPVWGLLRNIYQLDTYPRYMVIDRQGNFIDAYLDYPMFPVFKEKIDRWYKEKR